MYSDDVSPRPYGKQRKDPKREGRECAGTPAYVCLCRGTRRDHLRIVCRYRGIDFSDRTDSYLRELLPIDTGASALNQPHWGGPCREDSKTFDTVFPYTVPSQNFDYRLSTHGCFRHQLTFPAI